MKDLKLINIAQQNAVFIAKIVGGKLGEKRNITANFYNIVVNVFKTNDKIIVGSNGKRYRVELVELEPLPKERLVNERNRPGGSF